jgi:hypothetical protein
MKQPSTRTRRLRTASRTIVTGGIVLATVFVLAAPSPSDQPARVPANKYIGAAKCKNCHDKDDKGNQYGVWENAAHAKAFETLGSDAAKAIAMEKGIEDAQKADECLKCHTTAFGVDAKLIKKGFKVELGVQCESCHGPGDAHLKARFKAAAAGDEEAKPEPGEIVLDVTQATCLECHNEESPTFEKFCYYERLAEIRHPRPDSTRAVLVCGCGECGCETACPDDGCGVPADK